MQLLAETEVTTTAAKPIAWSYLWFGGTPVAQIDSVGAVLWYATDHLNTPILQTDATANVVWRPEFTPYGEVVEYRVGPGQHQPLQFSGQIKVDATDINYNVFRWNRPTWGRYTQADPLGLVAGPNLFQHVQSNPVRFVGRLGLIGWTCDLRVFTFGAFGLGGADIAATCVSDCYKGKNWTAKLDIGLSGISLGPMPVGLTYETVRLQDPFDHPNPENLRGVSIMKGIGATPIYSHTEWEIGWAANDKFKAGSWGGKGVAVGFDVMSGWSTLINKWQGCCK